MRMGGIRNLFGAFADGAVLFPLLAALSLQAGFDSTVLLAFAGAAYLASAAIFRVPMSVQPLKSIAIAGLALGATSAEVRVSGAALGAGCLLLAFLDADRLAGRVPASLIHGLQLALGVLLMMQGLKYGQAAWSGPWAGASLVGLTGAILLLTWHTEFPILGVVATAGLAYAVVAGGDGAARGAALGSAVPANTAGDFPRGSMVAALVFPQLALTLANSVLGTRDVARRYFGARAGRVTVTRLLRSIGVGNLLAAAAGGLPYCHGSGGVTAHVRGGSTHWVSNVIIGAALLVLAGVQFGGGALALQYPRPLMACLLFGTGVFHLGLARPTWESADGKIKLLVMGAAAALTQNMLYVLGLGILTEVFHDFVRRSAASDSRIGARPPGPSRAAAP